MRAATIALSLALAGCASSSGAPASGFIDSHIAHAYIPLERTAAPFGHITGAAMVIYKGDATIAVTNAHNYNLIDHARYIGAVPERDLIFFRVDRGAPPQIARAYAGERVRAYGQGADEDLREASGTILGTDAVVPPLAGCADCKTQQAIAYDAPAGPGFSGGPLIDEKTGALVGITFAYDDESGRRVMYAYDIEMVMRELAKLER